MRFPFRRERIRFMLLLCVCLSVSILPVDASPPRATFAYQGVDEAACANSANPVVAENCLPGTDAWVITAYKEGLEIYASTDTLNVGEAIDFFVQSSTAYDLNIYRLGYYGGLGGREVYQRAGLPAAPQPTCARADDSGLRTCSTWSRSYTLSIPPEWVSGVYLARVQQVDGGQNETVFVVREDERDSALLYQQGMTTVQAYNNYGGKSTYDWNSGFCPTLAGTSRAVKVSFNRPYNQTLGDPNYFFRVEYPLMRWLEQNGYDLTYSTNMDTHRSGKAGAHNELLDHQVFVSSGHDEYWSQEMRDAVTAARDAGVHLAFMGANNVYWRVRFEPDPLTREPDSVMVVYKTTEGGPADPTGVHTGTWRDPQGANNPENALLGVMYIGDNDESFWPLRISAEQGKDPLYRHTLLNALPEGTFATVGNLIMGWEWDSRADNGFEPAGLRELASTPIIGMNLTDAGDFGKGDVRIESSEMVYYTAPSGALVFSAGTLQWSWGLGMQDVTPIATEPIIAQVMVNLFSDMGAQPATPDPALILDGSDRAPIPIPEETIFRLSEQQVPEISDIRVDVSGIVLTFYWKTDIPTTSQVWTGRNPGAVNVDRALSNEFSTEHELTITNRSYNTNYYFSVGGVSRDWVLALSDEGVTTTDPAPFPASVLQTYRPAITRIGCWARANTSGILLLGGIGAVLAGLVAVYALTVRRRRARA